MIALLGLLTGPLGRIVGIGASVLAAAGLLWAVYASIHGAGVEQQQAADLAQSLKDTEISHAVDDETRRAGDAGVAAKLRQWTRE